MRQRKNADDKEQQARDQIMNISYDEPNITYKQYVKKEKLSTSVSSIKYSSKTRMKEDDKEKTSDVEQFTSGKYLAWYIQAIETLGIRDFYEREHEERVVRQGDINYYAGLGVPRELLVYPRKRKAGENYGGKQAFSWDDLKHHGILIQHWKSMIGERVGDGEIKKDEFEVVLKKLMNPSRPLVYEVVTEETIKDTKTKEQKQKSITRYCLNDHGLAFLDHKHNLKTTDPEYELYELLDNFNKPKH